MKIFAIIKTLDKKQRSGFLAYITLYHKPESEVYKMALWLDTKSARRTNRELSYSIDEILSEIPFRTKQQSLSNTLTTLGNLAEEYLGWMVWKDSPDLKRTCQLNALACKSLTDQYLKTQKEILRDSDSKVISIWDDYYKMRALFNNYYYQIDSSEDNYTQEFNNLLLSFRTSTATIAQFLNVEIKNREILLSESWDQHKEFFNLLYNNKTNLVHITDELIQMNYNKDISAYEKLMDILYSDKIDNTSLYIQYSISTYCIVFLTGKIKQGDVHRGQELLDLYEFSLEKGIFTLNESMSLNAFTNIIGVASKLEKYEWARNVVDNWAYKVDRVNYKTIAKFGQATIDFHQKKYEKVVIALSQMKSSNFMHRLKSRWLLLKSQYEINKNYIGVVKLQVDNFRRFLISNESRIKKSTFEGIQASVKILNMVLDRKDTNRIMEYYKGSKYIFERKWIVDKIKNPMR